jgi:hypothetical protein
MPGNSAFCFPGDVGVCGKRRTGASGCNQPAKVVSKRNQAARVSARV